MNKYDMFEKKNGVGGIIFSPTQSVNIKMFT